MQFFKWLALAIGLTLAACGSSATEVATKSEQSVIVHFTYGSTDLKRLFELEDRLESVLAASGAGEYDGNEIATDGSDGYLFLYGPNADRLFEAIAPVLKATPFMRGAQARKRYGPPEEGVKESIVIIES